MKLKLTGNRAKECRLIAEQSDVGRTVRIKPLQGAGRCWWVKVHDISEDGRFVQVGPDAPLADWQKPVPAKRQNRGFGRRRWVLTAEVVTWKRKAGP